MLLRRDYQAIAAAVAGREYPQTASPIAEQLILSLATYRAVGGDSQEWLQNLRAVLGDNFIANIFRENPKSEPDLEFDGTDEWSIIAAKDLWRLPPVEWIIPGIVPERALMMVYGSAGVGKSFLCLDYALQIAQHSPVIYIAAEGESGLRQRVAAWCKHNNKPEGQLFFIAGAVRILDPEKLEEFLNKTRSMSPRLVVVDTLARSMVGHDENSTRDMGLFVQATDRIKREFDCTALLVHHTKKDGNGERGSSALRGACDQIIKLNGNDDLVHWEVDKTKDAEPLPPQQLKRIKVKAVDHGQTLESCVFVLAENVIPTVDSLTNTQKSVLDVLALPIFANGIEVAQIAQDTQKSPATIYRALNTLKQLELIEVDGKIYKLATEGRKLFSHSHDSHVLTGSEN